MKTINILPLFCENMELNTSTSLFHEKTEVQQSFYVFERPKNGSLKYSHWKLKKHNIFFSKIFHNNISFKSFSGITI